MKNYFVSFVVVSENPPRYGNCKVEVDGKIDINIIRNTEKTISSESGGKAVVLTFTELPE